MSATTSTEIMRWQDAPEEGRSADEWPYPTDHVKYLVGGELAARIVARFGQPEGTPVFLTEHQESGGYSEYTQETDYSFTVDCGEHRADFDSGWEHNALVNLERWLKETTA